MEVSATSTDSENAALCMDILVKAVGVVNTERFIVYMKSQSRDYTASRHELYDDMTAEQLDAELSRYECDHPHEVKNKH